MAIALVTTLGRPAALQDSATFAHVAERFRRAGDLHRAVALCRDGLKRFPTHVSARVTLGLSLLDLAQYSQARAELQQALKRAPDNLAAIRGLAQLHDHPDEGSHLDDDEDLRAQNHWRSLAPHAESSTDIPASAAVPASLSAPLPQENTAELERFAPELSHTVPAAEVRPQLVRFGHVDVEMDAFPVEGPSDVPAPSTDRLDTAPTSWEFDPDLAAYNAALPITIAAPVTFTGSEVTGAPVDRFEFAPYQPPPPNASSRSELIAAALERLLTQVNAQASLQPSGQVAV